MRTIRKIIFKIINYGQQCHWKAFNTDQYLNFRKKRKEKRTVLMEPETLVTDTIKQNFAPNAFHKNLFSILMEMWVLLIQQVLENKLCRNCETMWKNSNEIMGRLKWNEGWEPVAYVCISYLINLILHYRSNIVTLHNFIWTGNNENALHPNLFQS